MRKLVLALCLLAAPAWSEADAWAPFLGTWTDGQATMTFTRELGGQVIVRRNHVGAHEDLAVIHAAAPGHWDADFWDNEGHVIHYDCQADGSDIVCVSRPAPGPRFRYRYSLQDGKLHGRFEIAPPGGDFKVYKDGELHRT